MKKYRIKTGVGRESRRFLPEDSSKPCVIAGLIFEEVPGLAADSDGDVVFHSVCNAISSISGVPILEGVAAELCYKNGITDSQVYVEKALETLKGQEIEHIALSIEGKRPRFEDYIFPMREKLARVLKIDLDQVGLTVTSGDGLTDFGCGEGIQSLCILTVSAHDH